MCSLSDEKYTYTRFLEDVYKLSFGTRMFLSINIIENKIRNIKNTIKSLDKAVSFFEKKCRYKDKKYVIKLKKDLQINLKKYQIFVQLYYNKNILFMCKGYIDDIVSKPYTDFQIYILVRDIKKIYNNYRKVWCNEINN